MNRFNITRKKLLLARTASYFGSSFSDFILPLFVYTTTKSPTILAVQWALSAISKVIAGKLSGRFHILRTNKQAIILLDLLQALAVLIPLFFWNISPVIATILSSTMISFLVTLQVGYIDSTIVNLTNLEVKKLELRSKFNASLENGKNIGQFLGYITAWFASSLIGYKFAIIIDSFTFIISAIITLTIIDNSKHNLKDKVKESFSLLFSTKSISLLTVSQSLMSFSIFIFNSSFLFFLKDKLNASDFEVAVLLILQSLSYILGSSLADKFPNINLIDQFKLRSVYLLIFIGFYFTHSSYIFIFLNCILSILISFTQPKILSLFQGFSNERTSRSLGSSRASLMAIAGLMGSVFCAIYTKYNFYFNNLFLIGAFISGLSIILFYFFINNHELKPKD